MKAKLFSLLSVIMLSIGVSYAESVQIGDLYYNLNDTNFTAEVAGYSWLTEANIPASVSYNDIEYSVTSIKEEVFFNHSDLISLTIPNSVTSIGADAFFGCSGLTSVTIPSSVTNIGTGAFSSCSGLTSIIVETGNNVYDSRDNCNAIIETATNKLISGCQNTIIPNSVTIIGEMSFHYCSSLTQVTIPNSVTTIERSTFSGCSGLTSLTIPSSVTSIEQDAIYDCSGLTSMSVEAGNQIYDSRDNCNAIIETASNTLLYGCQNTVIPSSVTSIGDMAFHECGSLTSITIPGNITSIGHGVFGGCTGLTSVEILNGVTSIGGQCFEYCRSLTSVTIPSSVTGIEHTAFSHCSSLTSITIPSTLTRIEDNLFYDCTSLTSIDIPSRVTSIGSWAFRDCSGLTSITCRAASVPKLGDLVFDGVDKSIPLYVPERSVEAYQTDSVWGQFTNILALPESEIVEETVIACGGEYVWREMVFTESGDYTIETDSTMVVLHLTLIQPEYVTDSATINYGETFNWRGRVYSESGIYLDTTIMTMQPYCDSVISCLYLTVLPYTPCFIASGTCGDSLTWTLSCDSVLTVSGSGEMGCADGGLPWTIDRSSITRLVIEDGVTSIGYMAFMNFTGLKSINLPSSITSIGQEAFFNCSSLAALDIPSSVTSIEILAFGSCSGLTSISVAAGNTVYDSRDNCNAIIETATNTIAFGCQNTIIPRSIISIGDHAFYGCSGLTSIDIPSSVTSIGTQTFGDCINLTSIDIPNSVTSIKDVAFAGCSGLTTISIPNSVTNIDNGVFDGCSNLTSITIPSSVIALGINNFANCSSLIYMSVEEGNSVYDSRDNCNAIIETASNTLFAGCRNSVIPSSVTSIGANAFYDCTSLTSVTIPNSIISIAPGAFNGCSNLASVEISSSVTSIGAQAFQRCNGLTSITCRAASVPQLGELVFEGVDTAIPLYVPESSIEAYRTAEGWSEFTNILAIDEVEETITACGDEYVWHEMVFTESGDYTIQTDSAIVVLHLTLIQPEYVTDSVTIYDNDSLVWKGRVLRESGLYCDTIISKETGCDSLIICLELTVLPYVPPTVTIFGEEVVITDPDDSTIIVSEVDILGDSTLIYTPADNTLTLSDVLMEAGDSITAAISYTGSDPLTIVLCDSSTIVADTVISSASDIIITGTGTLVAEGVVPIVGAVQATITFDSVSMIVRSLSSPAAVRRRIRGGKLLDENGGPALSGFATADFNKTAVTPPEAEYGEVKTEESSMLEENTNALFVRNSDGTKTVLTEFVLTAVADKINDAVENISEEGKRAVSKCLIDGQLYILLPDGTRYTATGLKME